MSGSGCASLPMQMAAVMALKFKANAPNGASNKVATPVNVTMPDTGMPGLSALWPYPAATIAATPGRFCDAIVTTNSGSAKLMAALQVNCGVVQTGKAKPNCTLDPVKPEDIATYPIATSKVSGTVGLLVALGTELVIKHVY